MFFTNRSCNSIQGSHDVSSAVLLSYSLFLFGIRLHLGRAPRNCVSWMSVSSLSFLSLLSLYNLFLLPCVNAALSNRTIDDQLGDSVLGITHAPTYSPGFSTHIGNCPVCSSVPVDYTKVFEGTWHDGTHTATGPPLTISASFSGVAVYVFNIIANDVRGVLSVTDLALVVDGQTVDHFSNQASNSTLPPHEMLYQVPVLTATNLPNGQHSLQIVADGDTNSLVLFDYIEYTFDDEVGGDPTSLSGIPPSTESILTPTASATDSSLVTSTIAPSSSPTSDSLSLKSTSTTLGLIAQTSSSPSAVLGTPTSSLPFILSHSDSLSAPSASATPSSLQSASSSTAHRQIPIIAGSVSGASIALALLFAFYWLWRRRTRARRLAPSALYLDKNSHFVLLDEDNYLSHGPRRVSPFNGAADRVRPPSLGLVGKCSRVPSARNMRVLTTCTFPGINNEGVDAREPQVVRPLHCDPVAEGQIRMLEATSAHDRSVIAS